MKRRFGVKSVDAAPAASRPLLEAVKKQFGVVPNLFRLVANSPAALEGYLGMSGALAKGSLPAPTRERIALDPGFGFGKTVGHNLELLRNLERLAELGAPVLVGLSRKSVLGRLTGRPATDRVAESSSRRKRYAP